MRKHHRIHQDNPLHQQQQMRDQQQHQEGGAATTTTSGKYRPIFRHRHHQHSASDGSASASSCGGIVDRALGTPRLVVSSPHSDFPRPVPMGNAVSAVDGVSFESATPRNPRQPTSYSQQRQQGTHRMASSQTQQQPRSNLSALLEGQQHQPPHQETRLAQTQTTTSSTLTTSEAVATESACTCGEQDQANTPSSTSSKHGEADSASGPPPPPPPPTLLGHSAPAVITTMPGRRRFGGPMIATPPPALSNRLSCPVHPPPEQEGARAQSVGPVPTATAQPLSLESQESGRVRRCLSSKELGTLAPPSGSPYVAMLSKKEALESEMTERLREKRDSRVLETTPSTSPQPEKAPVHQDRRQNRSNSSSLNDISTTSSSEQGSIRSTSITRRAGANEDRNRRRAAHNRAIVDDLCNIVADLFISESKLINPTKYGVSKSRSLERDQVLKSVQKFVSALPTRYALGADTPSEVLLHMRLMAVARSDPTKCVVHIINLDNDSYWTESSGPQNKSERMRRLVTIACCDAVGLLEYITKLLGTGGSRVLDADVMLSSDRIVLDRFVVEMNGRLRLDKLAHLIEAFLKKAKDRELHDSEHQDDCSCQDSSLGTQSLGVSGPLYFNPKHRSSTSIARRDIQDEIQAAVPLTEVLASPIQATDGLADRQFETLKRHFSMPNELACRSMSGHPQRPSMENIFTPNLLSSSNRSQPARVSGDLVAAPSPVRLQPRPDRNEGSGVVTSGIGASTDDGQSMRHRRPLVNREVAPDLDKIGMDDDSVGFLTVPTEDPLEARVVPLIPFDELMLIETIGMGRVSTIYRAAWQNAFGVQMVALKVAMVNPETGDRSHVDELRREADIAARLEHPGVCSLVGVAADAECFCLAYAFCEGGSVLSLLSDTSRYYEYLPIALDVANGMAYLHSRDVIHRDLKPSNILLTRDHRAKISDFGMSLINAGQELTAETGTYRYMAPEVIRHESYSSSADVYSFGVFLWQLITRQVPFASMTPVQAAYAVAEGRRPEIPESTPRRLREIIEQCWCQNSRLRPSFTYIAMALADYAKISFSPASVGTQTLQIANDMLATVEGNSNINVDFTAPVPDPLYLNDGPNVGLEI